MQQIRGKDTELELAVFKPHRNGVPLKSMEIEVNSTNNRSSFVTVLAWIFIVISGLGTITSLLQNIMIQMMFNSQEMEKAMQFPVPSEVPPFAAFMVNHFQFFFIAFFAISAITLASSIELLKRKNWARLIFIGLMVFGVAWHLGSLVMQFMMFSSMREISARAHEAPDMKSFMIVMAVFNVVLTLGFSILFGWIAKKLLSPAIVSEFKG